MFGSNVRYQISNFAQPNNSISFFKCSGLGSENRWFLKFHSTQCPLKDIVLTYRFLAKCRMIIKVICSFLHGIMYKKYFIIIYDIYMHTQYKYGYTYIHMYMHTYDLSHMYGLCTHTHTHTYIHIYIRLIFMEFFLS